MSKTSEVRLIDSNALNEILEARANMAIGNTKQVFYSVEKMVNAIPTLTLNTMRDAIYADAVANGLWEDCHSAMDCASLIFSEVSELESSAEHVYQDGYVDYQEYAEELADVIIMSLSVAGKLGIDIDAAVRRKMEINSERPCKHGKED